MKETKIGFWNNEVENLNLKLNATKARTTVTKILSKFIYKFNQEPDKWLNELDLKD